MLASILLLASSPNPVFRTSTPLTTGWERTQSPEGDWKPVKVPNFEFIALGAKPQALWYRRTIKATKPGRQVLRFTSALYAPEVHIDGKFVDRWTNGWTPHDVDVTSILSDGKEHQLTVRCSDRSAANIDGFLPPVGAPESALTGKVIFPLGGYKDLVGLIHPVSLETMPLVGLTDGSIRITTSVTKKQWQLGAKTQVAGHVQLEIVDRNGKVVLKTNQRAAPGPFVLAGAFPKVVRLWSPESPNLYFARLTLRDAAGRPIDQLNERFGFREFTRKGPDFFLNGVKRHLLATSTWPVAEHLSPDEVRRRIRLIKSTGANAFRPHLCPWQEDFVSIADEEGLLIINEAPVYTDGSGMYAYKDERFWENYREILRGMHRRDANHPSLVIWSLGNEILFMGNQKYDADLPARLGKLGRFMKGVDPTRLTTFEADLDPDGAFDIIGLHYPHELPFEHAYPVIADWLAVEKQTDAAGGMLGTTSSRFLWDRKKPLYIGEYLWVPMGDYSPGTVFFGDEAYLNRASYNQRALGLSWIDQTIAYRRANVSGLCPWTAMNFGAERVDPVLANAQRIAYRKLALYVRNRAFRVYAGKTIKITFDVFNDLDRTQNVTVIRRFFDEGRQVKKSYKLAPGSTASGDFEIRAPSSPGSYPLSLSLQANQKLVYEWKGVMEVRPAATPVGPSIQRGDLGKLASLPEGTVPIIAAHALDPESPAEAKGLPVVGGESALGRELRQFIAEGGRAVVLEQNALSSLGLPITLRSHLSTMGFTSEPGWKDVQFWGPDMILARQQIARTGQGGVRSLIVTGGPDGLAQSPAVVAPLGRGHVVLLQTEVGAKAGVEPAAWDVIRESQRLLKALPRTRTGKVLLVGTDPATSSLLRDVRLDFVESSTASRPEVEASSGVIVVGEAANADLIRDAIELGKPIVWLKAGAEAFARLKGSLGASQMEAVSSASALRPEGRDPLLRGITREELVLTSPPRDWNKSIRVRTSTVRTMLRPILVGLPKAITVPVGTQPPAKMTVSITEPGWYEWQLSGTCERPTIVELQVDDVRQDWLELGATFATHTPVFLSAGKHNLSISLVNASNWTAGPKIVFKVSQLEGPRRFPSGVRVLAGPGAMLTWNVDRSPIVVTTLDWAADPENRTKAGRVLGALLANLSLPFVTSTVGEGERIPLAGFKVDSGPYNEAGDNGIVLRSDGSVTASFFATTSGPYRLLVDASSTPAQGEYARVRAFVDGKEWGVVTTRSAVTQPYDLGSQVLPAGRHAIRIVFDNDAGGNGEDRNLFVANVRFVRESTKP